MKQEIAQPIKYFLYARKSSESEDRQMQSIEAQIGELTQIAEQQNIEVVRIFSESKSAKAPGREVFEEMIKRIKKGEANGIVCWKLNRLARNPVDGGEISWMLQQGIIQHVLTFGRSYYPSDNVLMMAVELGMANQFIRDLSVDTKRGLRLKAEKGWCPNMSALGYTYNPNKIKGEKEIINDPDRYDLVKKMWKMVISRKYTVNETHNLATKEWGLTNRKGGKVSIASWYAMLHNPFYYGWFEFPKGSGNWIQGKHEPMITRADFDKVQAMLSLKGNTRPKSYDFPYTGIIRCGVCGAMITAENKTKKNKNGNVHHYIFYHCTKRRDPNCPERKSVEEKKLAAQIEQLIKTIDIPPGFKEFAIQHLKKNYAEELEAGKRIHDGQTRALEASKKKFSRLMDMRLNNELSEAEFSFKKQELREEQELLDDALRNEEAPKETWMEKLEKTMSVSEDICKKFKNGDWRDKKQLVASLGQDLHMKDSQFVIGEENPILRIKKIAKTSRAIYEEIDDPPNNEKLELAYASSAKLQGQLKELVKEK
ncbi:MAG: recombinase family protein [Parcubacteria group bacterium]|jgi:DNA invertase Pin-like site-specific DNA recombinase/predicted metal-binding protein